MELYCKLNIKFIPKKFTGNISNVLSRIKISSSRLAETLADPIGERRNSRIEPRVIGWGAGSAAADDTDLNPLVSLFS